MREASLNVYFPAARRMPRKEKCTVRALYGIYAIYSVCVPMGLKKPFSKVLEYSLVLHYISVTLVQTYGSDAVLYLYCAAPLGQNCSCTTETSTQEGDL